MVGRLSLLGSVCSLSLFVMIAMTVPAEAEQIAVPSDPSASYTLLEFETKPNMIAHITTQRDGRSGRSFSKREVDCGAYKFRYLGDGSTIARMNASSPDPQLSPLIRGSISEVISSYACRKAGWR